MTPAQRRTSENHHTRRVQVARFRVVRFDGVLLGGCNSETRAETMRSVLAQGQRPDFAVVMTREAKS